MKRLGILWDPENPLVPVAPVVAALRKYAQVVDLTFEHLGHRTLPNGAYELQGEFDALLWIEGGPWPREFKAPRTACWVINPHLEPSLLQTGEFNVRFSALLEFCADERAMWLPLTASTEDHVEVPPGLSVLLGDPKPSAHAIEEARLGGLAKPSLPVVVALGESGRTHPLFFDCLRAGVTVVAGMSDLRGVVHVGEHADILENLPGLLKDPTRMDMLARRGPQIFRHLHEPELRAARIVDALWPRARVFGSARPAISVLVTCYRYLRRFKICLESLARQQVPVEIVVADPQSPDGLSEYLPGFAERNPHLRVVHLPLDERYHRNRGVGINRAFEASSGRIIVSIDGDMVFERTTIHNLAQEIDRDPSQALGIRRVFINRERTEDILSGSLDPFESFDQLALSEGDGEQNAYVGVLGYCQAVSRRAFAVARYPEEFDQVNQSDIVFVERLKQWAGVRPRFLEQERALHLWHPRNWNGTSELL